MSIHNRADLNTKPQVAGSIKFKREVPVDDLFSVMQDWQFNIDKDHWVSLHVRPAGDDGTHYLAFLHVLDDKAEATQDQLVGRLMKYLTARFGKDEKGRPNGVHGWSISTVTASLP